MLDDRFQEAIDMAAMRGGATDTDAYLADWRRAEPVPVGDDLVSEAEKAKIDIEATYDKDRLKTLIANGGAKPNSPCRGPTMTQTLVASAHKAVHHRL